MGFVAFFNDYFQLLALRHDMCEPELLCSFSTVSQFSRNPLLLFISTLHWKTADAASVTEIDNTQRFLKPLVCLP